jgi:ABC-type nitrate/sulfonate/bicarbonate transport system permease component
LKWWKIDRVTVFLFIVIVSFIYDLTLYLGIRDTARFSHPFVYFRSLGDVVYLQGLGGMLRQAIFLLVSGGLIGWVMASIISKNDLLTGATISFLRIAMWVPFLVVFAAPDAFILGVAAAMLAAIYYYLEARSFLDFSNRECVYYAAGKVTLQTLFFILIAQLWTRQWEWTTFTAIFDWKLGLAVFASLLALVYLINWFLGTTFLVGCTQRRIVHAKEIDGPTKGSREGVVLLTFVWLLTWEAYSLANLNSISPIEAAQAMTTLLVTRKLWSNILTSLVEISGGLLVGSLIATAVSTIMHRSENLHSAITKILPLTYLSPIVLWLLVFCYVGLSDFRSGWRVIVPGIGHKIIAVGFLTFFPIIQALWAFRDTSVLRRWLIGVDDALPIAFVAMLFGELYAATAGLGFLMVIASATQQYQRGLAVFLLTIILLTALSMGLGFILRSSQAGSRKATTA